MDQLSFMGKIFVKGLISLKAIFELHRLTLLIRSAPQFWGVIHPTQPLPLGRYHLSTHRFPWDLQPAKPGGCGTQTIIAEHAHLLLTRNLSLFLPDPDLTAITHTAAQRQGEGLYSPRTAAGSSQPQDRHKHYTLVLCQRFCTGYR